MSLDEKRVFPNACSCERGIYFEEDVKQFIRELKEEIEKRKAFNKNKTLSINLITKGMVIKMIDELAGKGLI